MNRNEVIGKALNVADKMIGKAEELMITQINDIEKLKVLVDEHIALLEEARRERDHHKQNASDLGEALTAEQLLNAELVEALEEAADFMRGNLEGEDPRYQPWCKTWRDIEKLLAKARDHG